MRPAVVYVAGPDVFKRNATEIYGGYAAVCKRYGVEILYPNDDTIEPANTRDAFALNIYRANINMIGRCDIVIANLEPFRGPSMDVGASFEIGHARAVGKPVVGFAPIQQKPYFERLKEYYGEIEPGDMGFRSKSDGVLLEDFGLNENLMIAHALEGSVHIGFESALQEALRIYQDKQKLSVAYEKPETDFPLWLDTFDNANNQHDRAIEMLEHFLDHLRPELPHSWRTGHSLDVLDLACGDGRFSRKLIELFERKLSKRINYVGADINPQFVEAARARFPDDIVNEGNIFEDLGSLIPPGFANDIVILSHAVYFAMDKCALAERLSRLGNADTLTLYLLNDPIYRTVPKDVDALIGALEQAELPYIQSAPFISYVFMPDRALDYISHLFAAPDARYPDEGFEKTRRLLFFFQQSPLVRLAPAVRYEFLRSVLHDLRKHNGKIPVKNHWIAVLRKDSPHGLRQSVKAAMLHMNTMPLRI